MYIYQSGHPCKRKLDERLHHEAFRKIFVNMEGKRDSFCAQDQPGTYLLRTNRNELLRLRLGYALGAGFWKPPI